jgi:hypothetical protein
MTISEVLVCASTYCYETEHTMHDYSGYLQTVKMAKSKAENQEKPYGFLGYVVEETTVNKDGFSMLTDNDQPIWYRNGRHIRWPN